GRGEGPESECLLRSRKIRPRIGLQERRSEGYPLSRHPLILAWRSAWRCVLSLVHLKALREQQGELRLGRMPLPRRPLPFLGDLAQLQPDQLQRRRLVREMAPCPYRAADRAVEALDGIGGIDHSPHFLRKGKKGNDLRPAAPPGRRNRRVFSAPGTLLELVQGQR